MNDLPFPWCVYEKIQLRALCGDRVASWSWGIENGLNSILTSVQSGSLPNLQECEEGVARAIATGSRVERNRVRLQRKYLRGDDIERHAERRMLARVRLAEIRGTVSCAEWELLVAAASGIPCHDIATRLGVTAGAVRTRLFRLRGRLAAGAVAARRAAVFTPPERPCGVADTHRQLGYGWCSSAAWSRVAASSSPVAVAPAGKRGDAVTEGAEQDSEGHERFQGR